MKTLILPENGACVWAGMDDWELRSADAKTVAVLTYLGEPPFGDSYHSLAVNGRLVPGYVWGCQFAISTDSRYLVCSWMEKLVERDTLVVDCENFRCFVLPFYLRKFVVEWPSIRGTSDFYGVNLTYRFTGGEEWEAF